MVQKPDKCSLSCLVIDWLVHNRYQLNRTFRSPGRLGLELYVTIAVRLINSHTAAILDVCVNIDDHSVSVYIHRLYVWEYLLPKQIWYIVDPNINREINLCNFASVSQQRYFYLSSEAFILQKTIETRIFCVSEEYPVVSIFEIASKKGKSVKAFALNHPKLSWQDRTIIYTEAILQYARCLKWWVSLTDCLF